MDAPASTAPGGSGSPPPARSRRRCVGRAAVRPGQVTWGSASTTGRQREMEDALAVVPDLIPGYTCYNVGGCCVGPPAGAAAAPVPPEERASASSSAPQPVLPGARFFAVYDGHGGSQVANYCARRLHQVVIEEWLRGPATAAAAAAVLPGWRNRWESAFLEAFRRVDAEIILNAVATDLIGSTALTVVLSACQIIVSNCGDSRAILCRGTDVIQLTVDHKPDNNTELARIEAGGGRVFYWDGPRVSGILAMTRAIGDRYLRPFVIPVPDVFFTARTEEDECLVMATDGLWDVMSNKDVGEVACRLLRHQHRNGVVSEESQPPAQVVADYLMNMALHKNSTDNISVIVIDLKSRNKRRPRT